MAQWKRKTQKATGELNDTKLLLEEQTSRNNLLEKKQRKFDAEIGLLQEDKKQEMAAREKLQREVDTLKAQKYGLEQQIHVSTISYDIPAVAFCIKNETSNFWSYYFFLRVNLYLNKLDSFNAKGGLISESLVSFSL